MNNFPQTPQDTSPAQGLPQPEPFIDRKEVAQRLGFDVKTIDKWKEKGFIPFYKINSRVVVFKWSEVEASLKANCRVYQGLE